MARPRPSGADLDRAHPHWADLDRAHFDWAGRAVLAESAVHRRHLRRLLGLPGTRLGLVGWPASAPDRLTIRWDFWWQAHLLDCALDAWRREPTPRRRRVVPALIRGIRLRNLGSFTNDYYDDMAWMALALQRAEAAGCGDPGAVRQIATLLLDAWTPPHGGIPWRVGEEFYNAPANGPAAILLARCGFSARARQITDWIDEVLRLPGSDLIADGVVPGEPVGPVYYTYCQGVVLGAEVALARLGGDRLRVHRLVAAVDRDLTDGGVLRSGGGGDGGLFAGILARYLAVVALDLPGGEPADRQARATAGRLVFTAAGSAWRHAASVDGDPLFGPDWTLPAVVPDTRSRPPERDLSVQLSGWMLTEAAARLACAGVADR